FTDSIPRPALPPTSFPSTTLFRSLHQVVERSRLETAQLLFLGAVHRGEDHAVGTGPLAIDALVTWSARVAGERWQELSQALEHQDRKSTRLNSSHLGISYAVFCLK